MRKVFCTLFVALALAGCERAPEPAAAAEPTAAASRLDAVLAAQPEDAQARYMHRNPKETLEFFGIEPGMTVVEALPGGEWYSKILAQYLGADGRLIGANYAHSIWPKFGFFDDAFIETMRTWATDWPQSADEWRGENGAAVAAFDFGSMPDGLEGQADAVLLIRALHNLARFESDGGYLTTALADVHRVLKPGGIVGVVQHEARPDMPDAWANGARGYLKRQFVIDRMAEAGFEFVDASEINQNPNDQPTTDDIVWRLSPTLATSRDDPELRERLQATGESNRMTLLFRKR
ncbi:MAG: hypothetical protein LC632_08430 [Xanthomonadaceae bacterium]|nr:hypothetical protein [Xanthomonadaceae bacterium]